MDDVPANQPRVMGFWTWLLRRDSEGDRGIGNIVNRWLIFHLVIACSAAFLVTTDPMELAKGFVIPTAGILIGLAFGWAGRSAGLLHDKDFSKFLLSHGAPAEGYIYSFQLAILVMFAFIALALTISVGGTDLTFGTPQADDAANRFLLGLVGSCAVREGWGTIYFVNKLTIQFFHFRALQISKEASDPENAPSATAEKSRAAQRKG